jgi:hypothetical protein
MLIRRGAIAVWATILVVFSATLLAQNDKNQQKNQPQSQAKLTNAQKADLTAINALIEAVNTGQTPPNDLSLSWAREDLLKAQGNRQYVPFTVMIDPSKTTSKTLTVYWRVMSKNAAPPEAPAAPPPNQRDAKPAPPKLPDFAYEDMNTMTLTGTSNEPARIGRSFAVPGGSYDVFVVVKEPTPERPQRNAPPLKASVIKHSMEVPDLWNNELNTSSVFIAERIDPLPAPLTPQQQSERPYALGTMEIVPVIGTKFAKSDELSTFLLIYNAQTDKDNKPDVTVEFNFYTKQAGAEKFFNKTNPQSLNAQTLPPGFDFAQGHQLQAGQAVPLGSFPEGDYRLEIKVTDKLASKTVTRDVNFTVAGS